MGGLTFGILRYFKCFFSDAKILYEEKYCRCAAKREEPAWCKKWWSDTKEQYCYLNEGLESKHCPGAERLYIGDEPTDDYFSSHPSICSKSERKLSYS